MVVIMTGAGMIAAGTTGVGTVVGTGAMTAAGVVVTATVSAAGPNGVTTAGATATYAFAVAAKTY